MDDTARMKFGSILKRIIKSARMSQVEVAERIGVTPQHLSNIITGRSAIPAYTFNQIAELLKERLRDSDMEFLVESFVSCSMEGVRPPGTSTGARDDFDRIIELDALEMLFCEKFKCLNDRQQIEIMKRIEQMERRNVNRLSDNSDPE